MSFFYFIEKDFTIKYENGFGEFSDCTSPREVYFPFGGTYNLFAL